MGIFCTYLRFDADYGAVSIYQGNQLILNGTDSRYSRFICLFVYPVDGLEYISVRIYQQMLLTSKKRLELSVEVTETTAYETFG